MDEGIPLFIFFVTIILFVKQFKLYNYFVKVLITDKDQENLYARSRQMSILIRCREYELIKKIKDMADDDQTVTILSIFQV